jgi:cytochrome c
MIKQMIAATALLVALVTTASAEGDAKKGERIFNKCKACHAVGEGAKNKIGPVLNGIVDRAAGQTADFKYSDALLAQAGEGLVWDEATLTAFLAKPKDFMDGTKMAFAGLRKEQEIMDVIAYLKTFE